MISTVGPKSGWWWLDWIGYLRPDQFLDKRKVIKNRLWCKIAFVLYWRIPTFEYRLFFWPQVMSLKYKKVTIQFQTLQYPSCLQSVRTAIVACQQASLTILSAAFVVVFSTQGEKRHGTTCCTLSRAPCAGRHWGAGTTFSTTWKPCMSRRTWHT